jgi:hypothetical protein
MGRTKQPIAVDPIERDLKQVEAELFAREGAELAADFRKFVEAAWHIVEPGTRFLDEMLISAICSHLQELYDLKFSMLLINVPQSSG